MKIIHTLIIFMTMTGMDCIAQTVSGKINGHDYVDLGLPSGLKWATTDLNSSGNLFAWGETKEKDIFSFRRECYKWSKLRPWEEVKSLFPDDYDKSTYEKQFWYMDMDVYVPKKYVKKDKKKVLDPSDDAAIVNWKKPWRMPTAEEFQELYEGCQWEVVANGYKGTSKKNGAVIILSNGPDGGYMDTYENETMTFEWGFFSGSYWSASVGSEEWSAYSFLISNSIKNSIVVGGVSQELRYRGLSIRPVYR